jgi:hypothetical protein
MKSLRRHAESRMPPPRTIAIAGLDGTVVTLLAGAIWRIRRALPSEAPQAVRVDHGGGAILTPETVAALLAKLAATGTQLLAFHAPDGTPLHMARGAIQGVRPTNGMEHPGAGAVLLLGGTRMQAVRESVDQAVAILDPA